MPYSYHLIVYQEIVCVCVFFFISSFRFANIFQSSISALQHGQSSITLLRFNLCYIVSRITLELNKRATIKSNARKIAEKFYAEAAYSYAVNWKAINKYLNLIKLHGKRERKKFIHDGMMHSVLQFLSIHWKIVSFFLLHKCDAYSQDLHNPTMSAAFSQLCSTCIDENNR